MQAVWFWQFLWAVFYGMLTVGLLWMAVCMYIVHGQFNDIIDKCYNYLESHLCEGKKWNLSYHFYRPSIEKYSADQWLWDSGAHMIVWSHRNVTNSILDLRTMLQFQQKDGRIPEEIFWSDRTPEEDAKILLQYSSTQFTGMMMMIIDDDPVYMIDILISFVLDR